MTIKHKQKKSEEKSSRLPPVVVVPDKTYIDDTGELIPTDVILISDRNFYERMQTLLEHWNQ